ncbi:6270_t:CDS:10, partial [Diversispora eburnea]
MGVPAFFRYISRKYKKIIEVVSDNCCDNLYLDANGIVHNATHPQDKPAPTSEDEMMIEIFNYIERIMSSVRPKKLLYIAIDGVAPRAKMNQQRSRRFRTAREEKDKLKESSDPDTLELMQAKRFDSNCITPGTPFMTNLAKCLRYWVAENLNSDPEWRNLKVILSDSSVPGEGEHKIMDFIRSQRTSIHHDPNTRHIIYGLDADLIMLSLGTHEPHFKVLREDVFGNNEVLPEKPFILLNVEVVREYLTIELKVDNLPWSFNLENAIDDWILLCFFVGNDFLPHLPSLEIREGAIDSLISIWKRCLPLMGGYITDNGNVNLKRLQYLVTELGKMEDEVFIRRHEFENRSKRRKIRNVDSITINNSISDNSCDTKPSQESIESIITEEKTIETEEIQKSIESTESIVSVTNTQVETETSNSSNPTGVKRKSDSIDLEENTDNEDPVRLWEPGFKERYYKDKFDIELSNHQFRADLVKSYVEGICWVMQYYFQGVPSWKWYYPYHYSPFASDFTDIGDIEIDFKLGEPFKPFEHKESLPEQFHVLMESEDSVVLLPFIDESRLLKAVNSVYPTLGEEETARNTFGSEPIPLDPKISDQLIGYVAHDRNCIPESTFSSPLPQKKPDIVNDKSLSTLHKSVLLENVKLDPPVLGREDYEFVKNGGRGSGGSRGPRYERPSYNTNYSYSREPQYANTPNYYSHNSYNSSTGYSHSSTHNYNATGYSHNSYNSHNPSTGYSHNSTTGYNEINPPGVGRNYSK